MSYRSIGEIEFIMMISGNHFGLISISIFSHFIEKPEGSILPDHKSAVVHKNRAFNNIIAIKLKRCPAMISISLFVNAISPLASSEVDPFIDVFPAETRSGTMFSFTFSGSLYR